MNYRYSPDPDRALKAILARRPNSSLDDLRRVDPALRFISPDQLSLRLGWLLERDRANAL